LELAPPNGGPPEKAEIGWMLSDHGLTDMPELPPDLAARLAASA
jgi:hypothetical protein